MGGVRRFVLVCSMFLFWYWWQCFLLVETGGGLLAQHPALLRLSSLVFSQGLQGDDTTYTVTGPPTISAAFIDQVLSAYDSPAALTGQALYDLGIRSGIDPVYALAFFLHEDSFGETGIGAVNHSLGNIRCSAGYACQYGFRFYASWEEGYQDWYALILNGYVRGQVTIPLAGHVCSTVDEIVPVYAPSSDQNDVAAYIAATKHAVDTWRRGQLWA